MAFQKLPPNPIRIDGDFAYLEVRDRAGVLVLEAKIDAANAGKVRQSGLRWYVSKNGKNTYLLASLPRNGGKRAVVSLHRFVLDAPAGCGVDHIDGDALNNTLTNLRLASPRQNAQNRRIYSTNKSGFKGVSKQRSKWKASIGVGGRDVYLGAFATPEDAAKAYNEAAAKYFGEYARLNAV